MGTQASKDHLSAASPVLKLSLWLTAGLGVLCTAAGIVALVLNRLSASEINIAGMAIKTGHVGVALTGLGVIVLIVGIRNVNRNVYRLAALPPDGPVRVRNVHIRKGRYSNPTTVANESARREAYIGLWQKLEQINLDLREQRDDNPGLFHRLREINTYFVSRSLYFDDADQRLINDYIAAMNLQREKIFTEGDEDATSAFMRTWIEIPPTLNAEINAASERVRTLRAEIKEQVRRVAGSGTTF